MRLQGVIIAQITAQYEQWLERAKPHLDRLLILYLSFSMAGLIFTQCDWRDAEIPLDQRSPQREMMGAYTDSSIDSSIDSSTDSSTDSSSAEARDVASHQAEIDRGANHQGEQEQGQEQVLDPQEDGQLALNHSPDGLAPLAPPPIPHLSAPKIRPALESIGASTLGRDKRGHDQSQRDQSQRDQSQRDQSQRDQSQGEQPRNRALQVLSIEFSTARRSRTRAPRTFKRSTSKITMSITIRNKHKPQRLHIRWLRLNRSQQIDHLYVKYSSRYTLTTPLELDRYHERDGAWRVEIRSESGELIGEASFKVQ